MKTIVRNFTSLRTANAFVAAAKRDNPGATYRVRGPYSDGGYTVARNPVTYDLDLDLDLDLDRAAR